MDSEFTLDDFRKHLDNIEKLGMKYMIRRTPGMREMTREGEDPDVALLRVRRMIDAMTPEERGNPDIIDETHRARIANEAGVQPQEVSDFLKQFEQVRLLMKDMMKMSIWERIKMIVGLKRFSLPPPPPRPGA
jgi:signal recognition particle subunit SRP54